VNVNSLAEILEGRPSAESTKAVYESEMCSAVRKDGYEQLRFYLELHRASITLANISFLYTAALLPLIPQSDASLNYNKVVNEYIDFSDVYLETVTVLVELLERISMNTTDVSNLDCPECINVKTMYEAFTSIIPIMLKMTRKCTDAEKILLDHIEQENMNKQACKQCQSKNGGMVLRCPNDPVVCTDCCPCHKDD